MPAVSNYLVLIRMNRKYLLSARNSIIIQRPIIEGYKGCILGLSENICAAEGCWSSQNALIAIMFPSLFYVNKFMISTPDIMQYDWQSGVDIICIPMTRLPTASNKIILQLTNIQSRDSLKFTTYHLPNLICDLEEYGANSCLSSSNAIKNLRGGWKLNMVLVHQWGSLDGFRKWFNSKEQKSARKEASENSIMTTLVFELKNITSCGFASCNNI